ncbi:MAG: TPM domain-containing protein [Treponema sp.]|nr:TPM domain-containing protein [Treponema sp.]
MKIKCYLLIVLLFLIIPAYAQETPGPQPRVIDNAGLLSSGQRESLLHYISILSSRYNFDLVILTERNIEPHAPANYAADFFESLGPARDGCIFLHVTESRDYFFSTEGRAIKVLNPSALSKLETDVIRFLRAGDNYGAYHVFLTNWEHFLAFDAVGRKYNVLTRYNLVFVSVAWLLAFLTGVIIVQIWKSGMNTALAKTHAAAYVVSGSLEFREKKDNFLFSTISRTKRQTESNTSSGGGVRTSSSGRSHGGGGGKY